MKVHELIERLGKFPANYQVYVNSLNSEEPAETVRDVDLHEEDNDSFVELFTY